MIEGFQSASLFFEDMFAMFVPFTQEEIVVALTCSDGNKSPRPGVLIYL